MRITSFGGEPTPERAVEVGVEGSRHLLGRAIPTSSGSADPLVTPTPGPPSSPGPTI